MSRFGNNLKMKITALSYQSRGLNDISKKIYTNYEQLKNDLDGKTIVNHKKNKWKN